METNRMIMEKLLHMCNLQNAIIKIGYCWIPNHRAAFAHDFYDTSCINQMIPDSCHQLIQNTFVDTRETFRTSQLSRRKLHETLG